jgi:hypothetical protein
MSVLSCGFFVYSRTSRFQLHALLNHRKAEYDIGKIAEGISHGLFKDIVSEFVRIG